MRYWRSSEKDALYEKYQSYKKYLFKGTLAFPLSEQIDLQLIVFYFRTSHKYEINEDMPDIFNGWFKNKFQDPSYKHPFVLIQEKEQMFLTYTPFYSPIGFNESDQRSFLITNMLENEDNIYACFVKEFKKFYLSLIPLLQYSEEKQEMLDKNAADIIFIYSMFQQRFPTLLDLADNSQLKKNFVYVSLKRKTSAFIYKMERRKDFIF